MSVPEAILLIDSRGFGGVETHVAGLARALLARGWSARVVMFREWGECPLAARCRATGVPLTILDGGLGKLLAFLRAFPPALLHTHGYKAGILGRLCARWTGVPAVSTYHSGDKGRGRVRLYTFLDRMTAGLGTAIAVSDEIARALPVAATIIENFVDLPRHEGRGDGGTIAFVGRLDHEKGPDIFCRLARRHADLSFEIFGDGPMRRRLEAQYGDRLRFHGAVGDMSRHWTDIGLLCMPSRAEGLPLAALEAMAHGVPVAAFAVGGLPRLLVTDDVGWLVAAGDEAALDRAVREWAAMSVPARQRMGARARQVIARNYATEVVVPRLLAVYEAALGTGRR